MTDFPLHIFLASLNPDGILLSARDYDRLRNMAGETGYPHVLLIDEINKAPRNFPNDLLHELDQMEFFIKETEEKIGAPPNWRKLYRE